MLRTGVIQDLATAATGLAFFVALKDTIGKRCKIIYKHNEHGIYLEHETPIPMRITVDELIQNFPKLMQATDIDPNHVRLVSIKDANRIMTYDQVRLDTTLDELNLEGQLVIELGPKANAPLPKSSKLYIHYSGEEERVEYQWYPSLTTLRSLFNDIVKRFSLESVEPERIHIMRLAYEVDLSSWMDKRLSEIEFIDELDVNVIVTPGETRPKIETNAEPILDSTVNDELSTDHRLPDSLVQVECSFVENHIKINLPCQTSLEQVKVEIEKQLEERPVFNLHLFNMYAEEISFTDPGRTLQSVGVEPGQVMFAVFTLIDPSLRVRASETDEFDKTESDNVKQTTELETKWNDSSIYQPPTDHSGELSTVEENHQDTQLSTRERLLVTEKVVKPQKKKHTSIIKSNSCVRSKQDLIHGNEITDRPIVTLQNLGNTCYMNSVLQCLANTPPLANYFLEILFSHFDNSEDDSNPFGNVGKLTSAFADFLYNYWKTDDDQQQKHRIFAPKYLKTTISFLNATFDGSNEQDAHEFLVFFLDKLSEELDQYEGSYSKSLIRNLFFGKIKSTITCMACQHERSITNHISTLSLPLKIRDRSFSINYIPLKGQPTYRTVLVPINGLVGHLVYKFCQIMKNADLYNRVNILSTNQEIGFDTPIEQVLGDELAFFEQEKQTKQKMVDPTLNFSSYVSLYDCIEDLISIQELENRYRCQQPKCQKEAGAIQRLTLQELPPVLIIQLKRFSHGLHGSRKIQTLVKYPLKNLDLTEFLPESSEPAVYDLIGTCEHFGSVHGGHYFAFAKRVENSHERWYKYDDIQCEAVNDGDNDADIRSNETYLLLYMKRGQSTHITHEDEVETYL